MDQLKEGSITGKEIVNNHENYLLEVITGTNKTIDEKGLLDFDDNGVIPFVKKHLQELLDENSIRVSSDEVETINVVRAGKGKTIVSIELLTTRGMQYINIEEFIKFLRHKRGDFKKAKK